MNKKETQTVIRRTVCLFVGGLEGIGELLCLKPCFDTFRQFQCMINIHVCVIVTMRMNTKVDL